MLPTLPHPNGAIHYCLIITANNGLPYVEVCMSSIHNNKFFSLLHFTRSQKASSYHFAIGIGIGIRSTISFSIAEAIPMPIPKYSNKVRWFSIDYWI